MFKNRIDDVKEDPVKYALMAVVLFLGYLANKISGIVGQRELDKAIDEALERREKEKQEAESKRKEEERS